MTTNSVERKEEKKRLNGFGEVKKFEIPKFGIGGNKIQNYTALKCNKAGNFITFKR